MPSAMEILSYLLFGTALGICLNQNRAQAKRLHNIEEYLYNLEQEKKEKSSSS